MLDLSELDTDDIPGVARERGNDLAKAAAVCLESQGHAQGATLAVRGYASLAYPLTWPQVTAQDRRTFGDPDETTEDGAAGLAILLAIREAGCTVVLRSRRGTGVDYWLGDRDKLNASDAARKQTDELSILLEDDSLVVKQRMEVSGIRSGNDRIVRNRTIEKLRQTNRSDESGLPVYVVVVEFGRPLAEVTRK